MPETLPIWVAPILTLAGIISAFFLPRIWRPADRLALRQENRERQEQMEARLDAQDAKITALEDRYYLLTVKHAEKTEYIWILRHVISDAGIPVPPWPVGHP